jgi:hypothetical protein
VWAAAALLAVAAVVGGVVLYVNSSQGRIRIEIDDKNAVLSIDGETVRIYKLGDPITLKPGEHGLVVKRGDVVVETRQFTVRRGDNPVLKITLPPAVIGAAEPGGVLALVVGVDHHDRKDLLPDLKYAGADATELADLLRVAARRPEDVVLMSTGAGVRPHLSPRRHNVRRELRALVAGSGAGDTLVVAFSGREILAKGSGDYYLGLVDADPEEPKSLLPLTEIYEEVAKSRAAVKLVLIDACRLPPPGDNTPRKVAPPAGVLAFFGCAHGEMCLEDADHKHGLFSYYVIEGLRGSADLNRDGKVMLSELERFVKEGVPEHAWRKYKKRQNPEVLGQRGSDTLLAVRSRKPTTVEPAKGDGFVPIFNGRDLTGWVVDSGDPKDWQAADGELAAAGSPDPRKRGWLLTEKDYANFILRLEFQLTRAANSGVCFRARPGDSAYKNLEIQILDDTDPRYAKMADKQLTGSLWGVAIDRRALLRPLGSWNHMEVEVRGRSLRVRVNGRETLNTDLDQFADRAADLPGLNRASGRIGLQSWEGAVWFRKIEVKELP